MLNAFWRNEPLDDKEQKLIETLFEGHNQAARRQNISSEVLKAAFMGSGDFNKSVVAAISTLGGTHAPIMQAYDVLSYAHGCHWDDYTSTGRKVPGWGNSFIKGRPDPTWDSTAVALEDLSPDMAWKINHITEYIPKPVYPNAACYTAATAMLIGLPKYLSPWLVIQARLETWAELIYDSQRQSPSQELRAN